MLNRYRYEKDEASVQKWRDAKRSDWDAEKKKMREKVTYILACCRFTACGTQYPTEEDLNKWLDETSNKSKVDACTLRSQPQVPPITMTDSQHRLSQVFFDMTLDGEDIGKIVMRLRFDGALDPSLSRRVTNVCVPSVPQDL